VSIRYYWRAKNHTGDPVMATEAPERRSEPSEATKKRRKKYEDNGLPIARREPKTVSGSRMGDEGLSTALRRARENFRVEEEERRERHRKALELRKQGHTYKTIGSQLDVSNVTAHKWVIKALREITAPDAQDVLLLELERLEGLYLMSYTALAKSVQNSNGEDPHLGAMDRCLTIMRQKARLMGLTDQQGNMTVVMGDQSVSIDQSTTNNAIIAAGSKDEYIAALAKAREAHGDNVGLPGTVTPELMPASEQNDVTDADIVEEEDEDE